MLSFLDHRTPLIKGEEETGELGHSVEVLKKARSSEYVDVEQEREEEEEGG